MNRCTTLTLVLALTATCGCSSNSLFGKRGRVDLDSTYADSSAIAKYPDGDSKTMDDKSGVLAAANYESANKLVEEATRIAESARPNEKNKLIESRALFQRALKQKPDDPSIHHQLAILSDKLQEFDDALYHYQAALKKDPKNPNLLSDLGYSYFLQKRYDKAEEFLTGVLEANPNHKHAAVNLVAVHGAQGNYDAAMSWFRRGGSEAEAQKNLAEFFPNGASPAANMASKSGSNNPFEGPAELQPERLIPANQNQFKAAAVQAPMASHEQRMPQINAGTSTAPNLQAAGPSGANPFESGFAAAAPQYQQQQHQQQPNPFENPNQFANNVNQATNQISNAVHEASQNVNRAVQQVGYEQQAGLPQWPHSPNQMQQPAPQYQQMQQPVQYQQQPVAQSPGMTIQPAQTVSAKSNQLPMINPGQPGSVRSAAPNVLHQAQQLQTAAVGAIQQTSAQYEQMPQVERNAQFAGMNAGPGQMFPVQQSNVAPNNFSAQVNQLQRNARNLIPQPAQNQIQHATAGIQQQVNSAINTIGQQGVQALNQIPQAQYEDVSASAAEMRNTLGNIVDQYQQQGSQLQQQAGQKMQQYGDQINNAVQQANPFAGQQLPQIFPGNSGQ